METRQVCIWGKLLPEKGRAPKIGSAQIETNFQNHEITGKGLNMFKATEVEKKSSSSSLIYSTQFIQKV